MPTETVRSRFRKTMSGQLPSDRLPVMEWAMWWDQTIKRWEGEGLPAGLDHHGIKRFFGLDVDYQLWFAQFTADAPEGIRGGIRDEADYREAQRYLYPDPVPYDRELWRRRAAEQAAGEVVTWITLEGFFWWPRVLLGIEPHLYAFHDQPDLLRRMNEDQLAYQLRCLEDFTQLGTPDFMTFAEDMSYNHGPMISEETFEQIMAPYYREVIPRLKALGISTIIDSDGGIEPLVPWFERAGLEGILPLERMAGVDVNRLRANHPEWQMIGGFDKTVMHHGEAAIRREFERLLPVMRSGRFVPSVDHQTPPGASLEDYRLYLELLREYAGRACGAVILREVPSRPRDLGDSKQSPRA